MTAGFEESISHSQILTSKSVRSWMGYLFGVLAAVSNATGSLFFKITDENKMLVVLIRSMLQFLLFVPIMSFKRIDFAARTTKTNLLLLLRGILGPITMVQIGLAMKHLTLGDTVAIYYTYPALVGFFACICLKEKCGILNVVLTFITLAGFALVAQPSFIFGGLMNAVHSSPYRIVGALFAFAAAVCAALSAVVVRKLGSGVHFTLSMLYAAWEGVAFVVIYLTISAESLSPNCLHSFVPMLGCGFSFLLGQAFQTLALQREKAGSITLIQTSEVVFSFLLEYIFLGEIPNLLCAIGAGLILFSCVALATKNIFKNVKLKKKN